MWYVIDNYGVRWGPFKDQDDAEDFSGGYCLVQYEESA